MITKSKKAPGTVFYIKYDDAGKQLIVQLKQHLNRGEYRMRIVGRHENRVELASETGLYHGSLQQKVPLAHATYVAVYLDGKTTERIEKTRLHELYNRPSRPQVIERKVFVAAEPKQLSWGQVWSDVKQLLFGTKEA